MARPLRIERPGAWYHITGRGVDRQAIFRDDQDRRRLLALIGEAVSLFGWVIHVQIGVTSTRTDGTDWGHISTFDN